MNKKEARILAILSLTGLCSVSLSLRFIDTASVILVFFSLYVGLNTLCYFLINKKKNEAGFTFSLFNTVLLNLSLTLPFSLKLPLSAVLEAIPIVFAVFFSLCMAVAVFQTNFSRKKPKESATSQEDEMATPLYHTPDVLMQPTSMHNQGLDSPQLMPRGTRFNSVSTRILIWAVIVLIVGVSLFDPYFWSPFEFSGNYFSCLR